MTGDVWSCANYMVSWAMCIKRNHTCISLVRMMSETIRSLVPSSPFLVASRCHGAGLFQDHFMGVEKPGDLRGRILSALGRAGDQRAFGNITGHSQGNATEYLDPFGDLIDQFQLPR